MNHRVGKVNQTTPLVEYYGKDFGFILLLPPVNQSPQKQSVAKLECISEYFKSQQQATVW